MRFSLKTAQLLMLGVVLFMGLPALLPGELLQALAVFIWRLMLVGLVVQVVFARGPQQAFAIGGLTMGGLQLWHSAREPALWNLVSYSLSPAPRNWLLLGIGLLPIVSVSLAAYFGRWVYHRLPNPGATIAPLRVPPPITKPATSVPTSTAARASAAPPVQPARRVSHPRDSTVTTPKRHVSE